MISCIKSIICSIHFLILPLKKSYQPCTSLTFIQNENNPKTCWCQLWIMVGVHIHPKLSSILGSQAVFKTPVIWGKSHNLWSKTSHLRFKLQSDFSVAPHTLYTKQIFRNWNVHYTITSSHPCIVTVDLYVFEGAASPSIQHVYVFNILLTVSS